MEKQNQKWMTVIHSDSEVGKINIREVIKYKDLIFLFVRRTFVARYKQTILGPAWAIIQPFLTTVVYTLFFGNIAGLGPGNVPNFIFYLSGTIVWSYFASCLSQCAGTFTSNAGIFGKVYFPRIIMPISNIFSNLIAFCIQYVFLVGFVIFFACTDSGVSPNWYIAMTPIILLQMGLLGLAVGVIIASITTKYRDLVMLIGFGVSLWSYASPVAYDMFSRSIIAPGGKFYSLYMLNPVTPSINIFRYAYLGIGTIDWMDYGISWGVTAVLLVIAFILFGRIERTFMDTV
ncbi:ABC transporter permease [Ruminococcus sp.]|uniref:ABC transporter permease n=1 Tax=Ruminococcus sp. TaxID=41978 RepID=UPI002E7A2CC0|nr:ABC transporter permease [Ruminococcus sp.]MEE1262786.1 ABC transporter permease [Ruminococcus sp.]